MQKTKNKSGAISNNESYKNNTNNSRVEEILTHERFFCSSTTRTILIVLKIGVKIVLQ